VTLRVLLKRVIRLVPGLLLAAAPAWAAPQTSQGSPAPAPRPLLPSGLQDGWYARIDTDLGAMVARLLPEQAPQTVAYFAAAAEGTLSWVDPATGETRKQPYYDGMAIHLAVAGQRFEAGDPTGTGRGAPYVFVPPEFGGPVDFKKPGRLGMTRSSLGRISGVQFFATASALPWLDGYHPCFGEVVSGREVIWALSAVKTHTNGRPLEPVRIREIRIHRVGNPPPLPEPVPYTPKPPAFGPKHPKG